jgi:hypothetical protein
MHTHTADHEFLSPLGVSHFEEQRASDRAVRSSGAIRSRYDRPLLIVALVLLGPLLFGLSLFFLSPAVVVLLLVAPLARMVQEPSEKPAS